MNNPTHRQHLAEQALPYAYTQKWDTIMTQQQEIYEELIASRELPTERLGPKASRRLISVRELTRDLAGWTPQMDAVPNTVKTQPHRS